MEIKIENLGPIANGKIDLSKDLIVFTGPNHTGKSYLAYLIYGLYKKSKLYYYFFKLLLPSAIYFFSAERTAINFLAKEIFRERSVKLDKLSHALNTIETKIYTRNLG